MVRFALRLISASAAVVLVTTAVAQPRDPRGWDFDERYYREDEPPEIVPDTVKLCSVYVPGNWRDTIPVPASWRWSDCRDYAVTVGATHLHLICLFERGNRKISMGGPRDLPEPNCGWGRRR
jgi:hypothetical protein